VKVVIDENLPPALARGLNALFSGEHDIIHIRDRFGTGAKDTHWIRELSAEGSWIVISGDRKIARVRAERVAFRSSNLVGFFLSRALTKAPLVKQAERILALWSTIEKQAQLVAGGAIFELPMRSLKLRQLL
jgi:hypothetical protein